MRCILLCAGAVLLGQAVAADLPAPKSVHFAACTAAGVEHGCIVAKGEDGALYNVGGATPGLKAGQWLQGTAVVTDRASYCMQGRTISGFKPDPVQKPASCQSLPD
jgi:hypothetical protein